MEKYHVVCTKRLRDPRLPNYAQVIAVGARKEGGGPLNFWSREDVIGAIDNKEARFFTQATEDHPRVMLRVWRGKFLRSMFDVTRENNLYNIPCCDGGDNGILAKSAFV